MVLKVTDIAIKFLQQRPDEKFTAREIADWIFENHPNECRQKQERSNRLNDEKKLLQQIVAEIGAHRSRIQKREPKIKTTEGRPRKYYFTQSPDSEEIKHAESDKTLATEKSNDSRIKEKEHDLYPTLSKFLRSELSIYSKRIDEKRSRNSGGAGGNKWLHPDLVGMEDLSVDWSSQIKNCVGQYADKKTKLWSFEVKILINRSNVREAFFQAVSNASWANFGYLVASDIQGNDTLKELRMLASLHGIGFICLDTENPSESQIMIPAKERIEIDWDTANRLTEENKDFREYIASIRRFYQTGDINRSDWDAIPDQD